MSTTSVSAPPLSQPTAASPLAYAIGQTRLWGDAMWGIMRRDAILLISYRTQIVSQFLGPLFMVAVF
jgi:hypothetical protein